MFVFSRVLHCSIIFPHWNMTYSFIVCFLPYLILQYHIPALEYDIFLHCLFSLPLQCCSVIFLHWNMTYSFIVCFLPYLTLQYHIPALEYDIFLHCLFSPVSYTAVSYSCIGIWHIPSLFVFSRILHCSIIFPHWNMTYSFIFCFLPYLTLQCHIPALEYDIFLHCLFSLPLLCCCIILIQIYAHNFLKFPFIIRDLLFNSRDIRRFFLFVMARHASKIYFELQAQKFISGNCSILRGYPLYLGDLLNFMF